MVGFTVLELVVEAFVLGIIVNRFAQYNANADFLNMLLVIGGTLIGGLIIDWQLAGVMGAWTLAIHALLLPVLLIWIAGTNPIQAAIITGVFFAVKIAFHYGLAALLDTL